MSHRDPDDERDEEPIDLSAWTAPTPPRGLGGRVLDAVRGSGGDDAELEIAVVERAMTGRRVRPGARRAAAIVGGLAIAAAAAGALWTLWPRGARVTASSGHVVAAAPSKIALGAGTTALVGAGGDLRWQRDGDRISVTHDAGPITYEHGGPGRLLITTPAGTVETAGATLHLEVPMNKKVAIGAGSAAVAAAVVIAVYEGKASVQAPSAAPRTVESGGQVALAVPDRDPQRFPTVARVARDRAQRDALAAAIAQARARTGAPAGAAPHAPGGAAGGGTHPGTAAASAPPPPIDPPGALAKDDVRQAVREVLPLLTKCYAAAQAKHPTLAGTVKARMIVDSEPDLGTIITIDDDGSDVDFAIGLSTATPTAMAEDLRELNTCLVATLESVVLPPFGGASGGHAVIHYPFVFAPSEEEAEAIERTAAPATPPADPARPAGTATSEADKDAVRAAEKEKARVAAERARAAVAAEAAGKTAVELLALAEDAAKTSKWPRALALAEAAVRVGGSAETMKRARLVAVLGACNVGSIAKARVHYAGIMESAQRLVRQRCLTHGIDLETKDSDDVVDPFESRDRRDKGGGGMINPFAE